MTLIKKIAAIPGIQDIHLTTNGVLTAPFVPELKQIGIASVNLSLDTLDKNRFITITRRNEFDKVITTFHTLLQHEIPVKINAVVMEGKNIDDIIPLVQLTKNYPVSVRFIEEMPFNGEGNHYPVLTWTYHKIIDHVRQHFPSLAKIADAQSSTSYNYHIPGHLGDVGVIAAFSRSFCGTCNRIRITAQGQLKTCLYDEGVLNVKELLRASSDDGLLREKLLQAFQSRPLNGFEAEEKRYGHYPVKESMSTIGG